MIHVEHARSCGVKWYGDYIAAQLAQQDPPRRYEVLGVLEEATGKWWPTTDAAAAELGCTRNAILRRCHRGHGWRREWREYAAPGAWRIRRRPLRADAPALQPGAKGAGE